LFHDAEPRDLSWVVVRQHKERDGEEQSGERAVAEATISWSETCIHGAALAVNRRHAGLG